MRVAFNSFPDSLVGQLNTLAQQQYQLQNQAATGQRIQQPADDPVAVQNVLDLQTQQQSLTQYQQNISTLTEQATATYSGMQALKTISDRVGEIATLAGNATNSPQDLANYGQEVTQLIQQAVQAMNSTDNGNYLFGGTATDQPPYVLTTDANGVVTGVTYQGNASVPKAEIAQGTTVAVTVPGANTSGTGPAGLITDSRTGADFFNHLISLQNHLLAGDASAVSTTDQPALSKDEDNIISQIGNNGSVQARLQAAGTLATNQSNSLTSLISQKADTDLAQTLVQLSQTQNAYQAALASGARIMNVSLLDYLQ